MPTRHTNARMAVVLLTCAISLGVAGCAHKTVHAAAPAAAPAPAEARPMNTAPDTDASPPTEVVAAPPALPASAAPPPAPVTIPTPKPATPHRPAGDQPADTGSEQPAHPPAPQISPELSPTDQAAYRRKTGDDAAAAEKNLQETSGKQLNAAQQDLVGKIRSFLSQSRDASTDGDWVRAQNLAQKARLLSNELINSF